MQILNDKHLTVTSFPLRHRVPTFGFLFREKRGLLNIRKELIDFYNIPHVRIPALKNGEDFITPEGTVIKNELLTLPPAPSLSYAYCSDTMYFSRLASFVKEVDLLYHEATFDKELSLLAKTTGHSTTLDAAKTAANANVKALIIGHFSSRYREIMPLVEESRTLFPNSYPAIDGRCSEVGNIM
jgi:ribonuclease Z